jgi:oligopeptide/dipeptide ABC transporter ATP-binding protein
MIEANLKNPQSRPLVKIEHLKVYFKIPGKGMLHAVNDISMDIMPNETLGLVGESGCGKSTVGNVLMRLIKPTGGKIFFEEKDIEKGGKANVKELTRKTQMIFQDPYSSLNPRKTVRKILAEPFKLNNMDSGEKLKKLVEDLAERVGLEPYVLDQYPHELDGGKRQMTGIARALAMNPRFIVCDEPVSALDVSVQATIINLLISMQKEMGFSYLFVSHDLSVVRHISNRVAVMYLGQIVELAPTDTIFENALHPYTIALLSAVPRLDFEQNKTRIVLTGDVPSPMDTKPGCLFAPRCWMASESCKDNSQKLAEAESGHFVACSYWQKSRSTLQETAKGGESKI